MAIDTTLEREVNNVELLIDGKRVPGKIGSMYGLIDCEDVILSARMRELRQKVYDSNPKGRRYGTDIIEAHAFTFDFDHECREDFLNGKAIKIDSVDSFDKKGNKIPNGLQSDFFGSDFSDDLHYSKRWSCACGRKVGQMFANEICPECNTEVQFSEVDLTRFGWTIINGGFKVIQPIYYAKLEALLGDLDSSESVIGSIIKVHYKDPVTRADITNDPNDPCLDYKDLQHVTKHPFIRRGMTWLMQHLPEVLDYYRKKKPNKKAAFQEIYDNIDKVFCSCIPEYSAVLRMEAPEVKGEKSFKERSNTCYRSIIKSVNKINEIIDLHQKQFDEDTPLNEEYDMAELTTIDRFCAQVQKDLKDLFEEEFKIISGKEGYIQSKVVAGRYNFSARNIIISGNIDLHSDEIAICYSTFIELFKFELIDYYAKYHNCTIAEASDAVVQAQSRFDKKVYYTMMYIIKTHKVHVIINRNPSINYGSFLALRIVFVKPDIDDRTLTVNKRILTVMNADFDGDQENIYRVFGDYLNNIVERQMNPKLILFIDKRNGRLNRSLMPTKDEAIGWYTWNNLESDSE